MTAAVQCVQCLYTVLYIQLSSVCTGYSGETDAMMIALQLRVCACRVQYMKYCPACRRPCAVTVVCAVGGRNLKLQTLSFEFDGELVYGGVRYGVRAGSALRYGVHESAAALSVSRMQANSWNFIQRWVVGVAWRCRETYSFHTLHLASCLLPWVAMEGLS